MRGAALVPNNSFKPNLLPYTKAMAEKACHGFGSTTQVGLTRALDARFGVAYAHRKSIAARLFLATHSHYNFSFIP